MLANKSVFCVRVGWYYLILLLWGEHKWNSQSKPLWSIKKMTSYFHRKEKFCCGCCLLIILIRLNLHLISIFLIEMIQNASNWNEWNKDLISFKYNTMKLKKKKKNSNKNKPIVCLSALSAFSISCKLQSMNRLKIKSKGNDLR